MSHRYHSPRGTTVRRDVPGTELRTEPRFQTAFRGNMQDFFRSSIEECGALREEDPHKAMPLKSATVHATSIGSWDLTVWKK
jgi:hypothetical protein